MSTRRTTFAVIGLLLFSAASASANRIWDREMRKLIGDFQAQTGRLERAVERQFRSAILRTATGEVDLGAFLNDFERDCRNLQQRYSPSYSASAEARACLSRVGLMEQRLSENGSLFGAEDFYRRELRPVAAELAAAYGVSLEAPVEDWIVRRVNDKELGELIGGLGKDLRTFRKDVKRAARGADRGAVRSLDESIAEAVGAASSLQREFKKKASSVAVLDRLSDLEGGIAEQISALGLSGLESEWGSIVSATSRIRGAYGFGG